jgi:hypothetical protein
LEQNGLEVRLQQYLEFKPLVSPKTKKPLYFKDEEKMLIASF